VDAQVEALRLVLPLMPAVHNRLNLRVTQQMVDYLRTALELGVRLVPGRNCARMRASPTVVRRQVMEVAQRSRPSRLTGVAPMKVDRSPIDQEERRDLRDTTRTGRSRPPARSAMAFRQDPRS
jgi:hypothetical protein